MVAYLSTVKSMMARAAALCRTGDRQGLELRKGSCHQESVCACREDESFRLYDEKINKLYDGTVDEKTCIFQSVAELHGIL